MKEWHYNSGVGQSGPHTISELQTLLAQGTISPATLVWKQGMSGWVPLQQALPELAAALPPALPPTLPPPVPPFHSPPAVAPAPPKKKGCLKALIVLGVVGVIVLVGLIVLAVAVPPFLKSLSYKKALARRDAAIVAMGLPANILPPEVGGYRLSWAADGSALGWLDGDYQPVPATGRDEGYDIKVTRYPGPGEAATEAGRMMREGAWIQGAPEVLGYFYAATQFDRHCYFQWSAGNFSVRIQAPGENEAKLREFVAAYQAASGVAPQ